MKTPYRNYPLYERDINPENGDIIMGELNPLLYDTRWKRKNRTARLKAKIARLTEQNKYLLAELRKTNEYYFNALMSLAKMRDMLDGRKEQE